MSILWLTNNWEWVVASLGGGIVGLIFSFFKKDKHAMRYEQVAQLLQSEIDRLKKTSDDQARGLRQEINTQLLAFQHATLQSFRELGDGFGVQIKDFSGRLDNAAEKQSHASKEQREELTTRFRSLNTGVTETLQQVSAQQKERLDNVVVALGSLTDKHEKAQETLKQTVEGRLEALRTENTTKLEEIRVTVDEKLQGTLEKRLGESFKQVSGQLEQVFKSMGEMQTLASGVGDLKKVLSNVKTRGIWGEVSLANLLGQIMAAEQFALNVEVKPNSGQRVEFAIRLPGGNEKDDQPIWLPIDSKFPLEDYERLIDAADRNDVDAVALASKALETRIRASAKDISDKYIHPPQSTDFAVLFLPTEGLFAEVIRRPGLVDSLQHDFRIVVAGPTTLMALLNSLRMGFRTLAIQKRSSEVWQVLAAIKTEFGKYGDIMNKVQKKLVEAQNMVADVGKRHRAIDRNLRDVGTLPEMESLTLLNLSPQSDMESDGFSLEIDEKKQEVA
jgi:DNA recombination protein RmuC